MRVSLGIMLSLLLPAVGYAKSPSQALLLNNLQNVAINGLFTRNPLSASQNTILNGWEWLSAGTGTAVWNGTNLVTLTGDGTNAASLDTSFSTIAGRTYTVSMDVGGPGGTTLTAGSTRGTNGLLNVAASVGLDRRFNFIATTAISWVRFSRAPATATTVANVRIWRH